MELQFLLPLLVILWCFQQVSAVRIVMAASRFLGAVAARVIPLSFAAGHCKSYWAGCRKVTMVIRQQIFLNFGSDDVPSKFYFNKCFKITFWRRCE